MEYFIAPAPVEKKQVQGKIGLVVAGPFEPDFLAEGIVKALTIQGVSGTVLAKVNDVAALPYAAQNLAKNVDVVIAASFLSDTNGSIAGALTSSLLQIGVTGRAAVVPALATASSLLEAKALLPTNAEGWAKSAVTILELQNGGNIEVVPAPEVAIPVKPVLTSDVKSADTLLDILRESLKERGARGIIGLGRKFRIADDNNNGHIDIAEFTKVINEHKLGWSKEQIKAVFDSFDDDKSGGISYDEFIVKVRGQLNERRTSIVLQAFQILDADKSGVVEYNDIAAKYNASKHPDVISGKRTAESVLRLVFYSFM